MAVTRAIDTMRTSILPHALQSLTILDTASADQRARLTAEDVCGPLDMLFEFGELDCAFAADPSMRPLVLFGVDSAAIGSVVPVGGWQSRIVGKKNLLVCMQGCEPSTGLR